MTHRTIDFESFAAAIDNCRGNRQRVLLQPGSRVDRLTRRRRARGGRVGLRTGFPVAGRRVVGSRGGWRPRLAFSSLRSGGCWLRCPRRLRVVGRFASAAGCASSPAPACWARGVGSSAAGDSALAAFGFGRLGRGRARPCSAPRPRHPPRPPVLDRRLLASRLLASGCRGGSSAGAGSASAAASFSNARTNCVARRLSRRDSSAMSIPV